MSESSPEEAARQEQRSLLRIYVIAGAGIIVAMMVCITIVVSEGQADALTRTVIALAPFISGAITLIGTGLGHRLLANSQTAIRTDVSTVKEESSNGVLSQKMENVTRTVLNDPNIQKRIADRLGETLIEKAAQAGVTVQVPKEGEMLGGSKPSSQSSTDS